MGYISYVGRVGALAVALGVGTAVATTPGIALATPSDSGSSGAAQASGSSSSADPDDDSPSTSAPTSKHTVSQTKSVSGGVKKSPPKSSVPVSSVSASSAQQKAQNSVASTHKASTALPKAGTTSSPAVHTLAAAPPDSNASPNTLVANATATVSPRVDPAPLSGPLAPLSVVTKVLSTVLGWVGFGPSMTTSPETPLQTPVLWTLLAFVRREIDQTLGSLAPAAHVQQTSAVPVTGPNLLVNPGAEAGDPSLSGYSSVTLPGWTVTGTPTVIKYGTQRRYPFPTSSPGPTFPSFLGFPSTQSAPPDSGAQFFGGGPVATSTLSQSVDLSAAASQIDTGAVPYQLSGDLGGFTIEPSAASVTVTFLDAGGDTLGTGKIKPVTVFDRLFQTKLIARQTTGTIPDGTRSAVVTVTLQDGDPVLGHYNDAFADNLSLTVGAAGLTAAPLEAPASTVGQLDHVFMVYLENKGVGNIVGSPEGPYLNSLINTYGYGADYYALTHPSDPNYYPILGGSDFGINYNCPSNCFNEPNLPDEIEAAGKTWAGYMEGGGGYSTPTDRLPFLAFSDIYDDPARVDSHLFDLSQMGTDLQSTATAPNYAWFAADDASNMEGPTTTIPGILQWALSELTTHQYNVAAGDTWLKDTLPMITDSPVWQDPTQKSAIFITFDEDYNNLSLGLGNEGNHVVTVVIPSPGAVANGDMRGGHFVADDYNNHYSLLATIEDSLGLPPLTNNDKYAEPMNDYWV